MLRSFLTYLKSTIKLQEQNRLLLAISGGVDSMVMLDLFSQLPYYFEVAHVNFSLRGKDSDADENLVRDTCQKLKIPFHARKFDTQKEGEEAGMSTQMIARQLRYHWFEELLETQNLNLLATAHHADDHLETALLNLVRGTGISGLKGILPVNGHIVRPLLFASKAEVMAYAKGKKIKWREDSSNSSRKYKRNFIRHEVVPKLKELNLSLLTTFDETAQKFAMDNMFIQTQFEEFKEQVLRKEPFGFSVKKDLLLEKTNEALVYRLFAEFDFDFKTVKKILVDGLNKTGAVFESESYELVSDRDEFLIQIKRFSIDFSTEIDEKGLYETPAGRLKVSVVQNYPSSEDLKDPQKAFLDFDKLDFPLLLRKWQLGDRFQPFGMKGSKLVSDYLIDEKVSIPEKRQQMVLVSNEVIVWLVGRRASEKVKIGKKTLQILKLEIV
ncbi:tRNA lysidine(34) synthetase TilS [Jiulongibacter sediminis]|uniref:tRNA(Ile)-lysidine synthase n=1 Tax=Jiulongibacter sediminis TaxID=1605367 RepID=A0A0P7BQ84_9BACT|nr:tRNA lysidine(34) synthetase TilS [Jiulongibacter sediminis]KPM49303.1 hypothetical protein AFM12_01375 [Jiulongibacter sediminis]TBX26355.1 hypothetical protein TK44_01380 [Jiulongibacter sediminis]